MTRPRRRTTWQAAEVPAERPVGWLELFFGGALVGIIVVGVFGLLVAIGVISATEDDDE